MMNHQENISTKRIHPMSALEWLIKAYIKFKYYTIKFRHKNVLKLWKIAEQEKS